MSFLESFSGNYDQAMRAITARRVAIGQQVADLTPPNIEAAIETRDPDEDPKIELAWVKVTSSLHGVDRPIEVEVKPTLMCGWVEDGSGFESEPGVTSLELQVRLPSGEERLLAAMRLDAEDDDAYLFLYAPHANSGPALVRWDSADADLLLDLFSSSLVAQTAQATTASEQALAALTAPTDEILASVAEREVVYTAAEKALIRERSLALGNVVYNLALQANNLASETTLETTALREKAAELMGQLSLSRFSPLDTNGGRGISNESEAQQVEKAIWSDLIDRKLRADGISLRKAQAMTGVSHSQITFVRKGKASWRSTRQTAQGLGLLENPED